MSDVTVSVIMAVYNSEDYLPTAVESILSQGLRRFELLLVDDGSRDRSGAICDQFAAQDERVIALHKENGGMCHARNYALEHARGEYVTFVDNDDTMLPGFLADNYRLAHAHDADCIRFGRWRETQDAQGGVLHRSEAVPHEFALVEHEDFGARYAELRYDTEGVWTGLYRRSMIDRGSLLFDESLRHGSEDRLYNTAALRHANRVVLNPRSYYVWMRRPSHSSSLQIAKNNLEGRQLALEDEVALMRELGVDVSNPALYARRVTMDLVATLRDAAYTDGAHRQRYADARETYRMLRDMYGPHFAELRGMPLDATRRTLVTALEHRAWPALFAYTQGGRALISIRSRGSR